MTTRSLLIMLALLVLSPIPTGAIDCSTLPPDSLSRAECERNAQESAKPGQQRGIEVFEERGAIDLCGPQPSQTGPASTYAEKRAEYEWRYCVAGRAARIEAQRRAEEAARLKAEKEEAVRNRKWVCSTRYSRWGSETECGYRDW